MSPFLAALVAAGTCVRGAPVARRSDCAATQPVRGERSVGSRT